MINNKKLSKFYDKVYLKGEKKHYTKFVIEGTPTSEAEEVIKQLNWKNKKVLEVGCGTGRFCYLIAKKGADVLGIDFSTKGIDIAKKTYQLSNLSFKTLDVAEIVGQYDVIVSIGTLEHMDNPLKTLRLLRTHLKPDGKIIITSPNWANVRGYVLITLQCLFRAPITLADLHYLTPVDFISWARKMNMNLKWKTFDRSWGHGELMLKDFERRIPRVLHDAKLPNYSENVNKLLKWLKQNVVSLDNSSEHSGAIGMYVFSIKKNP